ncbi:MAG: DNA alkylation repair protein [Anaerolineae bacterium]
MTIVDSLIERVQQTQHGFTDILRAADEVVAERSDALELAYTLFNSDVHQARMLAVFIFGRFAAKSQDVLTFLRDEVSKDENWRVQEILAQAFDQYCADAGYERVLPVIREWLGDERAHVRRAVSEGLRIWTHRPYFREHPETAVEWLGALHADSSEYVRKSAGNALRDISRKYPELVRDEIQRWDISNKHIKQTYKLASKFL